MSATHVDNFWFAGVGGGSQSTGSNAKIRKLANL